VAAAVGRGRPAGGHEGWRGGGRASGPRECVVLLEPPAGVDVRALICYALSGPRGGVCPLAAEGPPEDPSLVGGRGQTGGSGHPLCFVEGNRRGPPGSRAAEMGTSSTAMCVVAWHCRRLVPWLPRRLVVCRCFRFVARASGRRETLFGIVLRPASL